METLYGESPEIQMDDGYGRSGGIALYSAGDGDGETITGGSGNEGSNPSSSRIYWTITRIPDASQPGGYRYEGGITGNGWFFNVEESPFAVAPYKDNPAVIWNVAATNNSLNIIFDAWNADQSPAGTQKRAYFLYHISVYVRGCSSNTTT